MCDFCLLVRCGGIKKNSENESMPAVARTVKISDKPSHSTCAVWFSILLFHL